MPSQLSTLVATLVLGFLAPLQAQTPSIRGESQIKKTGPSKFMRIVKDDDGPASLETAIVRYRAASGEGDLVVDLVAVVHVGERDYYRKLNRHFTQYDSLLYELVGPPGARPQKGKGDDNLLRMVQKLMPLLLNLDSQLDYIDYTKKNFVHADLSPAEMGEAIKKRGDDGVTLALGIAADMLRQQNVLAAQKKSVNAELPDLSALLTDPAAPSKIKRLMAQQFEAMGDSALGPTINTILIGDRNQAAMKVLQKEIAKGKKKIGIFYGAAHMPDFEKRLREELDLVPVSTQWMTAWDLTLRELTPEELLLKLLRELR